MIRTKDLWLEPFLLTEEQERAYDEHEAAMQAEADAICLQDLIDAAHAEICAEEWQEYWLDEQFFRTGC